MSESEKNRFELVNQYGETFLIQDNYTSEKYENLEDFIKKANDCWKSRQFHRKKRLEAERLREMAVTVVEGFLALERLRKEWYVLEFDKED